MRGFINLLPEDLSKPKRTGPEEVIPVAAEAVPDFDRPAHLMPDDFWSNLKQFLFERPVMDAGKRLLRQSPEKPRANELA